MGWATGIAVYVVIWWVVIFMVLPWGVKTLDDADIAKGHAASAPKRPHLALKMAATTVVAAVAWVIVYLIVDSGVVSFRG
ncbi:MAG: DUF1467 family protein [Rhodospirillales bacterium]